MFPLRKGSLTSLSSVRHNRRIFFHILQCNNARLETIARWKEFKKAINIQYSCPAVVLALEQGILSWIEGVKILFVAAIRNPNEGDCIGLIIAQAFNAQDQIGWGQAIRGRLCHGWTEANNQYRHERFNSASSIPQAWTANAIFQLWKFGVTCWISRNDFIYGTSEQEKLDRKNNAINFEMKSIYLLDCNKINDNDSHLFDILQNERLEQNLEQKQLWIASVNAALLTHSRATNIY
jgi:hypothetical protein